MAAGQARAARLRDPRRVRIVGADGAARWHPVWEGNPDLARPEEVGNWQLVKNGPGLRPYIAEKSATHWTWRPFAPTPARLVLTEAERNWAPEAAFDVLIEPTLKARASPNKLWHGWREFVGRARAAGLRLAQVGPAGTRRVEGVAMIETPDFRRACGVLSRARAYVGHEGGLHHAAAALEIPAVVLFGGFIGPAQTGYAGHRNLTAGGEPCGSRLPCPHCVKAMMLITPAQVMQNLMELLNAQ